MGYLQRINYRPNMDGLSEPEQQFMQQHFDAYGAELVFNQESLPWNVIEEVELVPAPRAGGAAGWIVKNLVLGGTPRYHLGIYFGKRELVLPNITLGQAKYVLENIAFYAPQPIRYSGPEDLVRLTEI
jgi:hypothetical protein